MLLKPRLRSWPTWVLLLGSAPFTLFLFYALDTAVNTIVPDGAYFLKAIAVIALVWINIFSCACFLVVSDRVNGKKSGRAQLESTKSPL